MNKAVLKNFSLSSVSMVIVQIIQLLIIVITSKNMEASDFGNFTAAMLVMNFALLLAECGSGSYLIYIKKFNDIILSTCLSVNILFSIIIYFFLLFGLYITKDIFNLKYELIMIISLSIIFLSCSQIPRSTLEFNGKFNLIARCDVISVVLSFVIAIILNDFFDGLLVLILFSLSFSIIKTLLYFYVADKFKYKFLIERGIMLDIWRFSLPLVLNNLLVFFSRNNDQLIVGKVLGTSALGLYGMAIRVTLQPLLRFTSILQRVLLPDFSKEVDPLKIEVLFNKAFKTLLLTLSLGSIVIYFCARDFVFILLDDKWKEIIPIIQGCIFLPLVYSLIQLAQTILLSKGKTKILFKIQVFSAILSIVFVFIASYYFSVEYVAPFLTASMFLILCISLIYLNKELKIKLRLNLVFLTILLIFLSLALMLNSLIYFSKITSVNSILHIILNLFIVGSVLLYFFKSKLSKN